MNEKYEITEGAISNIFIKKNGELITPPITCGLLNGTYRRHLLETQKNVKVRILSLKDLQTADEIYICNDENKRGDYCKDIEIFRISMRGHLIFQKRRKMNILDGLENIAIVFANVYETFLHVIV